MERNLQSSSSEPDFPLQGPLGLYSVAQKYSEHLTVVEERELHLKKTLSRLETELKQFTAENSELKQHNSMLEARLSVLQHEKALHVKTHAGEKRSWHKEKQLLQRETQSLKLKYRSDYDCTSQLITDIQLAVASLELRPRREEVSIKKKLHDHAKKIKVLSIQLLESRISQPRHSMSSLQQKSLGFKSAHNPTSKNRAAQQLESLLSELEKKQFSLQRRIKHFEKEPSSTQETEISDWGNKFK